MRRAWTVPTDIGPNTGIRAPRLTKRGVGGIKAVIGNPVSFTVDPVLGCLPWLTLKGGQDAASQAARDQLLQAESDGGGGGFGGVVNNTPAPPDATTPGSNPTPSGGVPTGPFAYIKAANPKGGK